MPSIWTCSPKTLPNIYWKQTRESCLCKSRILKKYLHTFCCLCRNRYYCLTFTQNMIERLCYIICTMDVYLNLWCMKIVLNLEHNMLYLPWNFRRYKLIESYVTLIPICRSRNTTREIIIEWLCATNVDIISTYKDNFPLFQNSKKQSFYRVSELINFLRLNFI